MLARLRIALALGAQNIVLKSNSQLIIGQVRGDFEAKKTRMQKYLELTNQLVCTFHRAKFVQIPRNQNAEANEVARSASADDWDKINDWRLEEQKSPSIKELQTFLVHTRSGWTSLILSFLRDGRLPPNFEEAKKIQKWARLLPTLLEMYRRGRGQICPGGSTRGVCGDQMGSKSLVRKIMRAGYFWPTMQ